jgi:long-subunit fatty acid transport protein
MKNPVFFLPQVYFTYPVTERVTAGLGIFTPFGIGTDWPS